jgi:mono/diheme cytochrome c family protein
LRALAAVALSIVAATAAGCNSGTGGLIAGGDATRGKQLFSQKCAQCHTLRDAGATGKIGPDLDAAFGSDYAQGFKEATIRQVVADQIRFAGQYGTKGPTMPQNIVTGDDVDAVATYVASVAGFPNNQPGGTSTVAAPPPSTTQTTATTQGGAGGGSLAAGKKVFDDNGCGACHKLQAAGSTGQIGPDLDKLKTYAQKAGKPLMAFIHESIVNPNAYVEKGYPPSVMPTNFGQLPKSQLDALVQFLAASA